MQYLNPQYQNLQAEASARKAEYAAADPFPNIYFENFFNPDVLDGIIGEFPDLTKKDKDSIQFQNPNEIKLASKGEYKFGPKTKQFMHYLNSQPFLEFLQELTGIEETLTPDPYFEGGGCHQTQPGGFLKIHADFNKHKLTKLDRRLNVLVYLNKDWKDSYGGHFELWDKEMKGCVKKVTPNFNTMAIFSTTDFSYHGLPNPLTCPPDRDRKSVALYYYTNGRPAHEVNQGLEEHNTLFVARKDGTDAEMVNYGKKQQVKSIIKDFIPPIVMKMMGKGGDN